MPGRGPFFGHPQADTCVNLRMSKMKVYSAAICANGTQSTLALYKEKTCEGGPTSFLDIKENTKSSWISRAFRAMHSIALGRELRNPHRTQAQVGPRKVETSGSSYLYCQ